MRYDEQMFPEFHKRTQHYRTMNQLISKREKCVSCLCVHISMGFYAPFRWNRTHLRMNVKQLINFKCRVHQQSKNIFFVQHHPMHWTNANEAGKNLPTRRWCAAGISFCACNFVLFGEDVSWMLQKRYAFQTCNYEKISNLKQRVWSSLPDRVRKNGLDGMLAHLLGSKRLVVCVVVRQLDDSIHMRDQKLLAQPLSVATMRGF